jgi:hypothetical protein
MEGYSVREIFAEQELELLRAAQNIVKLIPLDDIRCHELSRVVGTLLKLEVQDGYYGFVDHSWLWTKPFESRGLRPDKNRTRVGFPNILDVYCVGSLPQVRLIDCQHTALPHVGWAYRPDRARDDIDEVLVDTLVTTLRIREGSWRPPKG